MNEEVDIKLKIIPVLTITVNSDKERIKEIARKIGELVEQHSILSFTKKDKISDTINVENSGIIFTSECYAVKIIYPSCIDYYILNI